MYLFLPAIHIWWYSINFYGKQISSVLCVLTNSKSNISHEKVFSENTNSVDKGKQSYYQYELFTFVQVNTKLNMKECEFRPTYERKS